MLRCPSCAFVCADGGDARYQRLLTDPGQPSRVTLDNGTALRLLTSASFRNDDDEDAPYVPGGGDDESDAEDAFGGERKVGIGRSLCWA